MSLLIGCRGATSSRKMRASRMVLGRLRERTGSAKSSDEDELETQSVLSCLSSGRISPPDTETASSATVALVARLGGGGAALAGPAPTLLLELVLPFQARLAIS